MTVGDFERGLNRALWGADAEPTFDQIRDGARQQLLGARGADTGQVRRIWEENKALPAELRKTNPALLDRTFKPPQVGITAVENLNQLDAILEEANMDRQSLAERIAAGPGPKITEADVNGAIARVQYWQPEGTTQTVACVQLVNGFTVVGSSACADPANFNEQLGRDLALDDARDQIWHLLGFQLREELYRASPRPLAPETEYVEEPPVGFSICYYDHRGLRIVPVVLAVHSREPVQVIQGKLLTAYLKLCEGLQPRVSKTVREAVKDAIPPDDSGPSAA